MADVGLVFKAHLVLGMTILLVFPFTRLVHMLSAPIWFLGRRGWQLVRTRRLGPWTRKTARSARTPVQAVYPRNTPQIRKD